MNFNVLKNSFLVLCKEKIFLYYPCHSYSTKYVENFKQNLSVEHVKFRLLKSKNTY